MDSRKLQGICFVIAGVLTYEVSSSFAAHLASIHANLYWVGIAHLIAALAAIPIVLGVYRILTKCKQPAP